jgi:hypothetical protein
MKQLKEQNQSLVEISRSVLQEVRDIAGEVRELRKDLNTRQGCQLNFSKNHLTL